MHVYIVGQRGGFSTDLYNNVVLVAATLDIAKEYVDDQIRFEEDNVPEYRKAWYMPYGDWEHGGARQHGDEWLRETFNADNDTWYIKEWEVAEG